MSRSIRICSYLLLPLIYLLVNVKIAQLGESFPITIVTFLPLLLLLFVDKISVKKLMIALGLGVGLTAFNYIFGQSLDASKYVTSTMLFVYIVIIIGMVWSIRFKTISPHNYRKILRFFYLVIGIIVMIAALEMAQIILTGGSSLMEIISKYLIYSNSYVLNFIKFGGKRTTALYFEPAFFALALISIWLSIKQFGIKTPKSDAMILAGIVLSGSFSGVMTFILFYLLEWAFQYLNKEAIKKKLPLAIISLSVFLVGVVFAFPYISERLGDLGTEGSSSYYRIIGPLVMVGYSLTHIDGVVRFGSLYEYVASFGIFNGADVGKTIDNGLYLLIIYFSWFAVLLTAWYLFKVFKMTISAFGDNQNFRVQLYLFTPVSLFFTGSIDPSLSFEWIVVDGGSNDGTAEFLEKLNGEFNLRYVSEKDRGIYDAMNKGIDMAQGRYAIFLNSGDIFHDDVAQFVRQLNRVQGNAMVMGDALLDFGDGNKVRRAAKPGWYIYHSLPASHQAIFFPLSGLKTYPYDLQYRVSSDYALTARMYKAGYPFKRLPGLVSEFSMGGVSTSNNLELCQDAKKVQRQILRMPGVLAELSYLLRLKTTGKTKALYNKA